MDSDTYTSREKVALLVGFASLAAAVLVAHASPPTTYELSIYAGTPVGFWAGVGVALFVATLVGVRTDGAVPRLALVLGGLAGFAVAGLPVVRSYYFFGVGDSLTHLGWAKDLAAGELSVLGFLYPGTHTVAVFLADATGMALTRAMLVTVAAFAGVYLAFVPLATWAVTRDPRATALAGLAALLFLPINNVSVFVIPHPTSQAIMFLPLVLYLSARYLTRADRDDQVVGTPTGVLLATTSVAVVLVHPQQAGNVIVVFGAILGLQLVAQWAGTREADHRPFAFQTAFLVVAFALWTPRHERATGATSTLANLLLQGPQVGGEVAQRAGSLTSIGGSFAVLFAKLFLVSVVFCALATLLVLDGLLAPEDDADATAFARYFGVALVPLVGLFAAYLAVSYETLHFRQLGFVMVLVTILGAVALSRGMVSLSSRFSPGVARTVVGVAFVAMLAASVPVVYGSPYVYQSSSQVTEAHMAGYETALEHRGSAPFVGLRGPGDRWSDAVLGYAESHRRDVTAESLYGSEAHPASGENFTASYVARHFGDRYLAYTDRAVQRERWVFDGLRFDGRGFRSLDAHPDIDRVVANGEFQLYRINGTDA